ncbi:MAG: globin family protein [Verrucomicrobiota bacterium]
MSLTQEEITQVQASWEKCIPISEKAAELFYGKLFELDPELRSLFTSDIKEQGKKLMTMITVAVRGLSDLEKIVDDVKALGVRHVQYGVKDAHYDTVGEALLWTLDQGLGEDFTPELKESWTKVYLLLAGTMKEAAAASSNE